MAKNRYGYRTFNRQTAAETQISASRLGKTAAWDIPVGPLDGLGTIVAAVQSVAAGANVASLENLIGPCPGIRRLEWFRTRFPNHHVSGKMQVFSLEHDKYKAHKEPPGRLSRVKDICV